MARVKNVGELDWAMYGIDDAFFGMGFYTIKPINIDDTEVASGEPHNFELQLYLALDGSTKLHPGTHERIDMTDPQPRAIVVGDLTDIANYDLKPRVIDEKTVGLLVKLSKSVEQLRVRTRYMMVDPNKVVIWLAFLTKELPEPPDKYLHRLARKMSRLARKK